MIYTVLWSPSAERRLAELWLDGSNRSAITQSARWIDELLRARPNAVGESRPDGTRILFAQPLGVLYAVKHEDRTVDVLTIWQFHKRV